MRAHIPSPSPPLPQKHTMAPKREGVVLDSTVLGGTFTPSLSLGGGVVRNFFLQDRTQRQDLFALPPSSKLAIALGIGTGLPGLPRWL